MGLDMWMTSCPEAMGWDSSVFWKKQLDEIWTWTERVDFLSSVRPGQYGCTRCTAGCWFRWDSQHSKNCISLSSCSKPKSQESNKCFVPEPRKSSVFRDSYACERLTHPYICIMYISHIRRLWVCYMYSVVAGLISSWVDHCWWDIRWSKQLFSVSVCRVLVFIGFSGHCTSIYKLSLIRYNWLKRCNCLQIKRKKKLNCPLQHCSTDGNDRFTSTL